MNNIGRNSPCPCGSGKKYKKCCLTTEESGSGEKQTTDIPVVNSLSEYIKLLEDYSGSNFLYRGEKPDEKGNEYPKRLTGAFRKPNESGFCSSFMDTVNKYYSETSHRISDSERQEFIAFSQHHGLMTNLLDVTPNPLVALFFACYGAKEGESSHVYLFDTMKYIDVSDIVYDSPPTENFIELISSGDYYVLKKLQTAIKGYFRSHRQIIRFEGDAFNSVGLAHIKHIMFNLYTYTREIFRKNGTGDRKDEMPTKTVQELMDEYSGQVLAGQLFGETIVGEEYFKELLQELLKEPEFLGFNIITPKHKDISLYYSLFLYCCLTISYPRVDLEVFTYFLPPMVYKPKVKFERLRNQQGCFIYQPYSYYYNQDITTPFQEIVADYTLKVNNATKIFDELDLINVNISTMFNDYDSIARYVQQEHQKKEDRKRGITQ